MKNERGFDPKLNYKAIHLLTEPETCYECHGGGCYICDFHGRWDPGWYFWNEIWTDRIGPYKTKAEVERAFEEFLEQL
jgi:hypothetical protein